MTDVPKRLLYKFIIGILVYICIVALHWNLVISEHLKDETKRVEELETFKNEIKEIILGGY